MHREQGIQIKIKREEKQRALPDLRAESKKKYCAHLQFILGILIKAAYDKISNLGFFSLKSKNAFGPFLNLELSTRKT